MDSNFSLVIPNYNSNEFIRETLENLQISELRPKRVIIVDDGSTDESPAIIKKNFPEFILIENKQNLGPAVARNIGTKFTEGEYIIFIDNDILIKKILFGN